MIDNITIDRIVEAAEIVDVISDFVALKKRGVNYLGNCPFHNEKTPSFTVSPAKGIFKCFGCSKGGNSVNFIMEHEHLSYPEALKYLAKKYNIEIKETEQSPEEIEASTERESMMIVTDFAQKFFTESLHKSDEGVAIGLSYFKERGFTEKTIERFQLGYSPEQRDALAKAALKAGYNIDFLVKAGLVIQKEDWRADRFHGRVMFPIHNIAGKVIAFGGRTLKSDKTIAKYLNSPESEIYSKSKTLYGLFFAKKSIIEKDKCFLVEGYTDVTSLFQAGIENVVASSGTSLTVDQIKSIKRFTNNITVLYDGDFAGIKASLRGINLILEEGMNVKVLLFPDNEDPDSFSRKLSSSELSKYISEHETDFISFKANLLLEEAKKDPIKKVQLLGDMVESISIIPEVIKRSVYIKECSSIMDIDEQVLLSEVNKLRKKNKETKAKTDVSVSDDVNEEKISDVKPEISLRARFETEEKELIRLLLLYGEKEIGNKTIKDEESDTEIVVGVKAVEYIVTEIENDELVFSVPVYKRIFEEYKNNLNTGIQIGEKYFINHPESDIVTAVADILSKTYTLSKIHSQGGVYIETEEMKIKELIPKAVDEYKNKVILTELRNILAKQKQAQDDNNKELFEELQEQYLLYTRLKQNLASHLGGRIIQ